MHEMNRKHGDAMTADTMSWAEALTYARIATKIIYKKSQGLLCDDDFDDMVSEGTIAIIECKFKDKPMEYYINVAKYSAYHWLMFWKYGAVRSKLRDSRKNQYDIPSWVAIEDYEEWIGNSEEAFEFIESPYDITEIAKLILKAKKRNGEKKDMGVLQDARMIQLRAIGYNLDAIAVEMSLSREYVKGRCQQLRRFILRLLDEVEGDNNEQ